MNDIIKCFYLTPRDIGIQKIEIEEMVELMKPSSNVNDGPIEFAKAIYEIFEKNNNTENFRKTNLVNPDI